MFTQRKYFQLKKVCYKVTFYECRLPSEIVNMMHENKASVFSSPEHEVISELL